MSRPGKAPCVVAFHGFTGTTSELRPMLDRLAERGFAVEAPLLPGHGSHPASLQEATFETWTAAMKAEAERAKARYERIVLCGFSLGSLVALHLAADVFPGPELAGIVLLGTAVTLSPPVRAALGFIDRLPAALPALPDWYMLKLWASDVRDPEQKKRIRAYDRDPLRAALEVYRAGRRLDPRLGRVTCPALVIHGGKDRVCPPSNVHELERRLGSKRLETRLYPNSAHLVAVDVDRDAVAEDVAQFVTGL